MIKVIFLDFDGTVSDAKEIARDSMARALGDYGYDFNKRRLRRLMGMKTRFILKELGLNVKDALKVRKRFYKYFTKAALDGGIKPCVSLKPLWDLKRDGVPLFVVSNARTGYLKMSVKKLEIKGLFKRVYGSERFSSKDKLLARLFQKMKIRPSEAMYVGDRFSDINYARNVGCLAVAIHNKCSWSSLSKIKKEKPDYIIKDFRGLKKILKDSN